MATYKSRKGSGMIELLIGIAIAIPLIIAALNSLKSAASSYNSLIKAASTMQAFGKLDAQLLTLTKEYDQHLFKIPPTIHRNGQIKFSSGQLNQVSQRTDSLRPAKSSDAITHLDFHFKNKFKIRKIEHAGHHLNLFCCPQFGPSTIELPIDGGSYLIFTTERASEFVGTRTAWGPVSQKCFKITGNIVSGMISGTRPLEEPYFAISLIPIKRIYTIYIDSVGRLRFLGHRGALNTENQPLANGPISAKYNLKNWPSSDHTQIEATFWPATHREFKKLYLSKLAKSSLLSLSLNEL